MFLSVGRYDSPGKRPRRSRPRIARLSLEILEDRLCPSGGYLFVDSPNTNNVLRYDETTGAFVDEFVKPNSGGLFSGFNMVLGPDHNLYVSNGLFSQKNKDNDVLRYDGTTGAFLGDFADSGQLTDPRGVIFGPDGNLYVADGDGAGHVLRYDGQTGDFLGTFVTSGSGGLSHPSGMLFGPDGNLYVIATDQSAVLRYDGKTGAPLPSAGNSGATFVSPGSGGLHIPLDLAFGPDGNLYVANSQVVDSTGGGILRYDGKTGAFLDTFIAPGSGGLLKPLSVLFGPEGDLFVGSADTFDGVNFTIATPHTSTVLRFDGQTGAFRGTFVTADSGGLRFPAQLLFTETDPVTLSFNGDPHQTIASSVRANAGTSTPLAPVGGNVTLSSAAQQPPNAAAGAADSLEADPLAGVLLGSAPGSAHTGSTAAIDLSFASPEYLHGGAPQRATQTIPPSPAASWDVASSKSARIPGSASVSAGHSFLDLPAEDTQLFGAF